MKTYIVRPYYGYDCDSVNGFNNGRYLEPIEVRAESPEDASQAALEHYTSDWSEEDLARTELNALGDSTLYRETYRGDGNGNADPDGDFYLYVYIDFSADVQEKTND